VLAPPAVTIVWLAVVSCVGPALSGVSAILLSP
jgi:hypothetical protein